MKKIVLEEPACGDRWLARSCDEGKSSLTATAGDTCTEALGEFVALHSKELGLEIEVRASRGKRE